MTKVQFNPDWASPPGETISDLLEERGWSQTDLAERTEFTRKHINDLIQGRAAISADTAQRLESVLGSTAEFWLQREATYQAAVHRQKVVTSLQEQVSWLSELPVSQMIKAGWIKKADDKPRQVQECLKYFGVASVSAWRSYYGQPAAAFRKSSKASLSPGAVSAWLRRGEQIGRDQSCGPFDGTALRRALLSFRQLSVEPNPARFVPSLVSEAARCGVVVAFVQAPPGCPASGATKWLQPEKALLLLSLRYKTNDHLWFTLFHEAAHILLHGKKMTFLEGVDAIKQEHEDEADTFARDHLISPQHASRLELMVARRNISEATVRSFAAEIGVAPGIVVGRMQKEGWLPWNHLNGLKVRYSWGE